MLLAGFFAIWELVCLVGSDRRRGGAIAPFVLAGVCVAVLEVGAVQGLDCALLPPLPCVVFPPAHISKSGLGFLQSNIGLGKQVHKLKGEEVDAFIELALSQNQSPLE